MQIMSPSLFVMVAFEGAYPESLYTCIFNVKLVIVLTKIKTPIKEYIYSSSYGYTKTL